MLLGVFDVGNRQPHVGSGDNDNGVFIVGNGNVCHAAGQAGEGLDVFGKDAFAAEVGGHFIAEIVIADRADYTDVCPQTRCCNRLVCALAAHEAVK